MSELAETNDAASCRPAHDEMCDARIKLKSCRTCRYIETTGGRGSSRRCKSLCEQKLNLATAVATCGYEVVRQLGIQT